MPLYDSMKATDGFGLVTVIVVDGKKTAVCKCMNSRKAQAAHRADIPGLEANVCWHETIAVIESFLTAVTSGVHATEVSHFAIDTAIVLTKNHESVTPKKLVAFVARSKPTGVSGNNRDSLVVVFKSRVVCYVCYNQRKQKV